MTESRLMPYETTDPCGVGCLVVAPHPDDETIGCGGTIARHIDAGDPVHVVVLTDGAQGLSRAKYDGSDYVTVRAAEARAALDALGGGTLSMWGYPDRELASHAGEAAERLRSLIEAERPGRVYCTGPTEVAPDHLAAWDVVTRAADGLDPAPELWQYEIWVPLFPDRLVDISAVRGRKAAALACYASQREPIDIARYADGLGYMRSVTVAPDVEVAEAFRCGEVGEGPAHGADSAAHRADAAKIRGLLDRMARLDRRLGEVEAERQQREASLWARVCRRLTR